MMLALVGALLAGTLILFAFGNALGARGHHQRAADLAAVSAAQVMRDLYPRLFEPPFIEPDLPNPRHLEQDEYLALARAAAVRGGRRNGVPVRPNDVSFPGGGFAPTRVTVQVRGIARVRIRGERRSRIPVSASATAELSPGGGSGMPTTASGGGYDGPLAYRQGKPMRPDVAAAFDRMAAAARSEAGLFLSINSAFRSDAEQARLFAANPNPKWVAPPGTSLHRWATELDLGPPAAYPWLQENHARFGFIWRYKWEPWH
jgi:D-alanyl-D-alanine carboxypeptidase